MKHRISIFILLSLAILAGMFGCRQDTANTEMAAAANGKHLYMDVHRNIEGLTAEAVAGAHQKDLEVQGKYGVDYKRYWFDDSTGTVFCLVEAPDKTAAATVHKEAHGLVADEIVDVAEGR